jgi:FxLD family lantipeptide
MTIQPDTQPALDDWDDLDVSIIEAGPEADRLIQMTDDGCTSTCASACPASGC